MASTVQIPTGNDPTELFGFSHRLSRLARDGRYEFDFEAVGFVTPAWMVLVGNALREFKSSHPLANRKAVHYRHLKYPAYAGFFRYVGLEFGVEVGGVPTSENFLPITEKSIAEIRSAAIASYAHPGDIIQSEADTLSFVLTRTTSGPLYDTMSYSIRELVRNVLEHSGAHTYTFAAQYWPGRNLAQVVVADAGIGLSASLRSRYEIADDAEAVSLAVKPGISSQATDSTDYDHWGNSGYGLFMTKELCRRGGSFSLGSGRASGVWEGENASSVDCLLSGTTVIMSLNTSNLAELSDRLRELARKTVDTGTPPSRASLSARR